MLQLNASAKLNLFLHVNGKRKDGFHNLQSLVVFCEDIYDTITLTNEEGNRINGEFAQDLSNCKLNLVDQILSYFSSEQINYILQKNIPIGAGLGGGSADAACVFRYLHQQNNLDTKCIDLLKDFGSDVPVCYLSKASFLEQAGEKLSLVSGLPSLYAVLINPLKFLSTRDSFAKITSYSPIIENLPLDFGNDLNKFLTFLKNCKNDFTEIAISLLPEIAEILQFISREQNALHTAMSGSGATCFALFHDLQSLNKAYDKICLQFPSYWIKKTKLC